ncbi:DEAD/DEAH box helicase [Halieaceae bacterium IMCC14734]|uniref:ATP-dependent RNA helicase DeaD n=1 Tax=Candidatus Litorirhabdus singularis TaxID=2518993 RepID=A0ABT3TI05_9GAMM|nr:DEAD/DEAH box helicase [Candidatus Litorirhabdus singularis]MCX2981952.1 DEAD/DEAH box helicase [Candidatus Litorirhabdus singularis]
MSEPASPVSFADLGLPDILLKSLKQVGYEAPSPIQAATIPALLQGKDMLGQAQTGTGKTAAFALPILANLTPGAKKPAALVLCPTRELAIQVAEAFQTYARGIDKFHVLPLYGGQDMRGQLRQLQRGVDVVVGTPGRLQDHLNRKSLDLSALRTVVLDEADEMLRMGFIDDVENILSHAPDEAQTVLFSATLPERIKKIAGKFLNKPEHVKIAASSSTVDAIDQQYWLLNNNQKLDALTRLLDVTEFDGVIIFTRTRGTTVELAEKISARGYACSPINGDMSQSNREQTISRLKKGKIDILVATDVAARGLDVDRITLVVNYDIPYDSEAYIHRIGRTGRAGREGKAVLFITKREQRLLRAIEKSTGKKIAPVRLPSAKEISEQRVERFKQEVKATLAEPASPLLAAVAEQLCEETGATPQLLAVSLIAMLQKDQPLEVAEAPLQRQAPALSDSARAPMAEYKSKNDSRSKNRNESKSKNESKRKPADKPVGSSKTEGAAESDNEGGPLTMETYRIEVGRQHDANAGNIVGAIANELDIDSQYIGRIELNDDHSTVDLPEGMPPELLEAFGKIRVKSRPLAASLVGKSNESHKPKSQNRADKSAKKPGKTKRATGKKFSTGKADKPARKPAKPKE